MSMLREMSRVLGITAGFFVVFLIFGVMGWTPGFALCGLFFLFGLFCVYFARNPKRRIPEQDNLILAPADGRIVCVDKKQDTIHVAIYLSLFDVHVNRIPCDGFVKTVKYRKGFFKPAFTKGASLGNESMETLIENQHGRIHMRQIAGILARRIVCRLQEGQAVRRGDTFGMIRFGSRVELDLPTCAELGIQTGDRVRAGQSILGRFKNDS